MTSRALSLLLFDGMSVMVTLMCAACLEPMWYSFVNTPTLWCKQYSPCGSSVHRITSDF